MALKPLEDLQNSQQFANTLLAIRRGIERETLRVDESGHLSQASHPLYLGSKLFHPLITTDYSEAQPELITPPSTDIQEPLSTLDDILRFIYSGLDHELLWSASMPCVLQDDSKIPLASYGPSNLGTLKTTYRHGLGIRYGRGMQTICAVHYNFSLPDSFFQTLRQLEGSTASESEFRSAKYFALMRNFRRYSWLLVYLFGASPAVCNSFVKGREHSLEVFDDGSLYRPYATSLRSGNLGYQSNTQSGLINVCYNNLHNYVHTLADAITTPHSDYEALGVGEGKQVNGSILQSEAEFYSSIRAKCVPPKGHNFLAELLERGVEYIEVRLLDVNPYLPLGIDDQQIRFLDAFLVYCLLADSPEHDEQMCKQVSDNLAVAVNEGRSPDCQLMDGQDKRDLRSWGKAVLAELHPITDLLDQLHQSHDYSEALSLEMSKLDDADLTPSGSILRDMREQGIPFFRFAMNQTLAHKEYFLDRPLSSHIQEEMQDMAELSWQQHAHLEAEQEISFAEYLQRLNAEYFQLL